ncbi:peptide/nickel transport system permease protein [Limimonas halophila]|uniref:Peptide/nickel transport system permease protein n=1 Tax=Limimonas halophila TaxID=1082479 RepID=A0A1G7SYE4_9PROT|nr:ABC transporter permease [Limimonas halophila]SDG28093.1 peptide/nickel transport system permease protein [Limimonas halophila]
MWFFLARRVGLAAAIVIVAVTLLYLMIHAVPGDPASIILGPRATPELKAELRAEMGLNQPLPLQILGFFWDLLHGDLGRDVFSDRPVADIVFERLPHTITLILTSIAWAAAIGIPLGCYSAMRRNTVIDKITGVLSVSTIAIPSFVMALYALLLFAVTLNWLPAIGVGDGGFWDGLEHLILPAFAVGISWVGYMARIVRASMLEVLGENHVRMVRAFGVAERHIVTRYALPIAIMPTVTLVGVGMAHLLSAAVFAETVFARPGVGSLIVDAVDSRNYPVVMGCVLVTTGLFVIATTIADVINGLLDPRTRENL